MQYTKMSHNIVRIGGDIIVRKNVQKHLASYALLLISVYWFMRAFMHNNVKAYFFYSALFLALFCVAYKLTEKKIIHKDGYNLLQAYLFFEKCRKKGIDDASEKLKKSDKEVIIDISKKQYYSDSFSEEQIMELYRQGRSVINGNKKSKERKG